MVAAFEQSLASMTSRLQSLTITAEKKENELQELRQIIQQMRRQQQDASPSKHDVHPTMTRQLSSDSVSSMATNASSAQQPLPPCSPSPSLKKKSWLRNSFSKAFSRSKRPPGSLRQSAGSDSEDSSGPSCSGVSTWSAPSSPMLSSHHNHHQQLHQQLESALQSEVDSAAGPETILELKKQLREKDMVLTDIRLEALSSAHQLEAVKETVSRMRVTFSFLCCASFRSSSFYCRAERDADPKTGQRAPPASIGAAAAIGRIVASSHDGPLSTRFPAASLSHGRRFIRYHR